MLYRATLPLALLTCLAALTLAPATAQPPAGTTIPFYIGTYTGGTSQGIYLSALDTTDGSLAEPKLVAELENASFLTLHPKQDVLLAVSEIARGGETEQSQVSAYQIQSDGSLKSLGGQPSGGDIPCYVTVDRAGQFALVANYGSGSVTVFPLEPDGSLGKATDNVQHAGASANPQRQTSPHAHCIVMDPSDRFALSADLGIDQILVYRLNRETGKLVSTGKPLKVAPGSGPRHLTFHPDGQHAFVIHELNSTLSALGWNSQTGELSELHTVSTLPAGFTGGNSTAEVLVHPNGKFVYGSNRGHHSIAAFAFDAQAGKLKPLGHTSTRGKTPRNFRIDPTGEYLLAENQDSHSIFVYRIDQQSGGLTPLEASIHLESPVCIKFLSR